MYSVEPRTWWPADHLEWPLNVISTVATLSNLSRNSLCCMSPMPELHVRRYVFPIPFNVLLQSMSFDVTQLLIHKQLLIYRIRCETESQLLYWTLRGNYIIAVKALDFRWPWMSPRSFQSTFWNPLSWNMSHPVLSWRHYQRISDSSYNIIVTNMKDYWRDSDIAYSQCKTNRKSYMYVDCEITSLPSTFEWSCLQFT